MNFGRQSKWLLLVLLSLIHSMSVAMPGRNHQSGASGCGSPASPPTVDCGLAPSANFDKNSRLWLAWAYAGHVYVNYTDDQGQSYSDPVVVNRSPEKVSARGENRPKVVVDKSGGIHVSWTKALARKYTGDIRYSYSDDGGNSFVDPVTVNDDGELVGHRFDALAVNDTGDVFLAWLDKRDREVQEKQGKKYRGAALYYSYKAAGDREFKANIKVADHSCECCRVAIDLDAKGLPVVMWRHIYGENIRDHGLVRFSSKDKFDQPVRVSYDQWKIDACPHHGPALSIDGDGRYHGVWFDDGELGQGLFYARSDNQGESFSKPLGFGNYNRQAGHPDVEGYGQKVFLTWKEFDGEKTQILLLESTDGGKQWGTPQIVASTSGLSDYPFLVRDGESVWIAWQSREFGYQLIPVAPEGHNHGH